MISGGAVLEKGEALVRRVILGSGVPGWCSAFRKPPLRWVFLTRQPRLWKDVRLAGNLAYVADGQRGLKAFDVSKPEALRV